jgi:hypothetical protein
MLNDILFVIFFLITRFALPILFTLVLGRWIERALSRDAQFTLWDTRGGSCYPRICSTS